ncbi:MAG: hypothetical protein EIB84_03575 [Spiroplasma poulsonii]|uniref:Uncharacterized protein n=1 Tax=Spiroplasma poulsonii TaxID=2138 RepID=A0A3S0SEL9_9MOLU|nr:hypothetical protein [Spiroplasma sp. hyd1]MBW1241936.1 hypothetical protein [Spiroplasma poulsonii]MBW3058701.1 hypothetical protein [Spiroplasma poulsonii]RUP77186.1 hypothetical protein D6D54_04195 [Spiroplasma poulsonii]
MVFGTIPIKLIPTPFPLSYDGIFQIYHWAIRIAATMPATAAISGMAPNKEAITPPTEPKSFWMVVVKLWFKYKCE